MEVGRDHRGRNRRDHSEVAEGDNMSEWLLKRYTMGRIDVFFAG